MRYSLRITQVIATPEDQMKMAAQVRRIARRDKALILAHVHGVHLQSAVNCEDCRRAR